MTKRFYKAWNGADLIKLDTKTDFIKENTCNSTCFFQKSQVISHSIGHMVHFLYLKGTQLWSEIFTIWGFMSWCLMCWRQIHLVLYVSKPYFLTGLHIFSMFSHSVPAKSPFCTMCSLHRLWRSAYYLDLFCSNDQS